ncbi:MAG TPA: hypothetical protein VMF89_12670, partial [Polyangiales bacterium]|nr:hypothetical protein [Polyangiales bacterium]
MNTAARTLVALTFAASAWLLTAAVQAQLLPDELESDGLQVHAFVSQGFALSTDNNYLTDTKNGTLNFTEAAINVRKTFGERLTIGMQLFSRKVDPNDTYIPVFDWFNVDYRLADWVGFRVGRVKIPFGLYNDSIDVDAARVPILLPGAVYPDDLRGLLFALTGAELYGNINLGAAGELEYRAYGGTFFMPRTGRPPNPAVSIVDTKVHYLIGGRLMWLTPLDGLQVGASFQQLRYEIDYAFDPA